jgi:uncharacterized protein
MQQIALLVLLGAIAGFLSGVLGLGGAIVLIPSLIWMGYSQQQAQGTTILMLVLPVGALAAWNYFKAGQADVRGAIVLAAAFFLSSYLGAKTALVIRPEVLSKVFAVLLLLIALKMLLFTKTNP